MQVISQEDILSQLARMIASSDFTAGPRVKKFLAHIWSMRNWRGGENY